MKLSAADRGCSGERCEAGDVVATAHRYRYPVDMRSDTAAACVLRFIGANKCVLDLGAGAGSITRPMVEQNGCHATAVELDETCIQELQFFCESVLRLDLNDHGWREALHDRRFDAIVFADVLEHLYDPWKTLELAATLLSEDGFLVASIPNSSHAAILGCLFSSEFEYRDTGLLDRTHIRFFGVRDIENLFRNAGLKIVDFAYVLRNPEDTELAASWSALPGRIQGLLESSEYAHVYQVVVRAVPAARIPLMPARRLPAVAASRDRGLKFIAFYLPQFHPIPENDRWWGKGFTEWTNVTKAQPLFEGHYQPHLPADFGFYDLRVRDVQHQQIECAKRFGIDAFCFYYYWFGATRLLERPVDDFLGDPRADINFCLCWANENWTRRWDGSEREILIQQTYSPENDIDFIKDLVRFFRDTRYMRVNHAPLLLVYCPQHIPDPKATTTRWRQYCREVGIGELHLVAALVHGNFDFEQFGFDAAVEFPPHNIRPLNLSDRVGAREPLQGLVANYEEIARAHLERNYANSRIYRSVFPSWDNTARAQRRATIILNSSPDNYERWLEGASERTIRERAVDDRLLFINAWNEWAEGCHLEPDRKDGFGFLEATQRVKAGRSELEPDFSSSIPAITPSLSTRALLRTYNLLKPYPAAFRAARSIYHLIRRA